MVVENPKGCTCPELRGDKTCIECYYSQVNKEHQWCGTEECWNAQCLVYAEED